MSDFATQLRRLRAAASLTQERLAELAGCSSDMLRAIESGRRRPSLSLAERLADLLLTEPAARVAFVRTARGGEPPAEAPAPTVIRLTADRSLVATPDPGLPPLLGRAAELAALSAHLANPTCRLLTIVGPGGIGKTSLALHAARQQLAHFPDGIRVALLAGVQSAADAIADLAALLGVGQGPDAADRIVADLRERSLVLLLDNVEHLLDDQALLDLIHALITQAPGVRLLATSRRRIALRAEWVFPLAGLPLPAPDDLPAEPTAAELLFLERTRRRQADFALTAQNRPAVAAICRTLGGAPLAIELAAAWSHLLTVEEIAAEIARDLDLLSRADRDAPERHRSMRAVFEGSWRLLRPDAQRALAGLALFRGGFTRAAAAAVVGADLLLLADLLNASLIRRDDERYSLHELIRQYAAEQLAGLPEAVELRLRFITHVLDIAETAGARFERSGERDLLSLLHVEHDNLRAALAACIQHDQPRLGARLCLALRQFWVLHGHMPEGIGWAEQFLAGLPEPDADRGNLLNVLAHMLRQSARLGQSTELAEAAVAIFRRIDDPRGLALALYNRGQCASEARAFDLAREALSEAQALHRRLGNHHQATILYASLADVVQAQGDHAEVERLLEAAYAEATAHGNRYIALGARWTIGFNRTLRGDRAVLDLIWPGIDNFAAYNYVLGMAQSLELLGAHAGMRGRHIEGGRLVGAALGLRARRHVPLTESQRALTAPLWAFARGPLPDDAWTAALEAGSVLDFEQALALARTALPDPPEAAAKRGDRDEG